MTEIELEFEEEHCSAAACAPMASSSTVSRVWCGVCTMLGAGSN